MLGLNGRKDHTQNRDICNQNYESNVRGIVTQNLTSVVRACDSMTHIEKPGHSGTTLEFDISLPTRVLSGDTPALKQKALLLYKCLNGEGLWINAFIYSLSRAVSLNLV